MAGPFGNIDWNPFSRQNGALINIILLCTYVFGITALLDLSDFGNSIVNYFRLTPKLDLLIRQPYSLVTYIFLHGGFFHLLGNMLWLYFIGVILADLTGDKHIWRLFLGGGIAGGLLFVLLYNLIPIYQNFAGANYMVGASAGVTAVIIGTAAFSPYYAIYLFGVLRVELRWIAVFRVVFDLMGVAGVDNRGGYIAHLGGAIFGLLYILHIKGTIHIPLVDAVGNAFRNRKQQKLKPVRSAKVNINTTPFQPKKNNQEEIDRILDKINKSGYESLSKDEKETLFRAGES